MVTGVFGVVGLRLLYKVTPAAGTSPLLDEKRHSSERRRGAGLLRSTLLLEDA